MQTKSFKRLIIFSAILVCLLVTTAIAAADSLSEELAEQQDEPAESQEVLEEDKEYQNDVSDGLAVEEILPEASITETVQADVGLTDDETALHFGQSDFMQFSEATDTKHSFNIHGLFNSQFIQTTYSNKGYQTAVKVNDNSKVLLPNDGQPFKLGKVYTVDGVQVRIKFAFGDNGRSTQLIYDLHNTTSSPAAVKVGSSADTMIGDNDSAQVSFSEDGGIIMEDTKQGNRTYGARFKLVPADGGFTTRWYGLYKDAYANMFTNSESVTPYSGDSGIAWSYWANLAPGETKSIASRVKIDNLFELGDVVLTADGENSCVEAYVPYEDIRGREQTVYYSIDGGEVTEYTEKGNTHADVHSFIDAIIPVAGWKTGSLHRIAFYVKDSEGLTTRTLEYSIIWPGYFPPGSVCHTLQFANSYQLFAGIKAAADTDIPLPVDSQPGYYFVGWEDPDGTVFPAGTEYTINKDVTLTAKWQETSTLSVTVNTDGAPDDSCDVDLYQKGVKVAEFPYSFGVYSGAVLEGVYQIYIDGKYTGKTLDSQTTDCTLNRYTVTFNTAGSGISVSEDELKTDFNGRLEYLPKPRGGKIDCYKLDGWYTSASGGDEITTAAEFAAATTVYAHTSPSEWHQYDYQNPDPFYLISPASYEAKAKYYCSCQYCGAKKEDATFEYGRKLNDIKTHLSMPNQVYNETAAEPVFEAYNGTPVYTYSNDKKGEFSDAVPQNVGTYYIKAEVTATDDYEGVSEIRRYEITPKELTAANIKDISDAKYTGEAVTPALVIKDGEKLLTLGVDYTVEYQNNIEITTESSKAKAVVAFIGNYTGNAEKEFNIKKVKHSSSASNNYKVDYDKWTADTPKMPFNDIKASDWYYDDIEFVYRNGLMNGTGNDTFAPQINTTRAMFITIIYRIEHEPESMPARFVDLIEDSYYEKAVGWGYVNGIVKGVSATEYAPNDIITREQMMAMIYRYAAYKGLDLTVREDAATKFSDHNNVSEYARPAVNWAISNGLIFGNGSNALEPARYASRAEIAALFVRVAELLQ